MAQEALSLEEGRDYLHSLVVAEDVPLFKSLRHSYLQGAFDGRLLIIYKATGITSGVPNPPVILDRIRISDFVSDSLCGSDMLVTATSTNETVTVGHVPVRLWDYPLFISIPAEMRLRWVLSRRGGEVLRTMLFGIVIRARSRPRQCEPGVIYALTPKHFDEIYPGIDLDLS